MDKTVIVIDTEIIHPTQVSFQPSMYEQALGK
jgi:hypothetical protein